LTIKCFAVNNFIDFEYGGYSIGGIKDIKRIAPKEA
jgi:hypothetical protein